MPAWVLQEGPPGSVVGLDGLGLELLDLKSRMFGWGLSSPNKQSTTLFKTEGHTGEGPGLLISISPPQGSATSYLEGPQTGGVGGGGRDQGWAAATIHPEVTWGPPILLDVWGKSLANCHPPRSHPDHGHPDSWPESQKGAPRTKSSPSRN